MVAEVALVPREDNKEGSPCRHLFQGACGHGSWLSLHERRKAGGVVCSQRRNSMSNWTMNDIPDVQGRVALVTGANSGLGLETTRALAAHGAHVIMACRNPEKARQAETNIKQTVPGASLEVAALDLASLASVHEGAHHVLPPHERLAWLFNNAGVMALPRHETKDGFELQFETNYLSHFALTGLLLPRLLNTPHSRVVTLTSMARSYAHRRLNFNHPNGNRPSGHYT